MATKMTKPAITTHPCHAQGGPQPQPYFFAGNQMCFLSFFIIAWLAANIPAQRPSIPAEVQLGGCSNFARDATIATATACRRPPQRRVRLFIHYQRRLRCRIEPEDAQLLSAAAGLRQACGPHDGLLSRGQFEHGEAAVEWRRPRVAAFGDRAIGRDEYGRHGFIDSATEDINAGGFRLVDHRVSVAAYRLQLAVGPNHRRAGKGNEILGHGILWELRSVARNSLLPNQNRMSDGGRGPTSLGVKVWKSSQ